MNDRYLFRAKRKNWKQLPKEMWWVEGYLYGIWERRYILWGMTNDVPNMVEVDPTTICQCTELKDKNGKLIWENDIMVAHLDDSFPEDTTYARAVWHNNGFCTKEQGSEDISPLDKFDQEYFEVCGNIFDNPELLEVGCGQELDWGETDYIHG